MVFLYLDVHTVDPGHMGALSRCCCLGAVEDATSLDDIGLGERLQLQIITKTPCCYASPSLPWTSATDYFVFINMNSSVGGGSQR